MRGGYSKFEKNMFRTFSEAAEKYKKEKKNAKDYDGISKCLRSVLPYIGHLPIIDVDNDSLESFKEARLRQVRAGTVNKELAYVTTVLKRACRLWRWIPEYPLILTVDGPRAVAYVLGRSEQDELFGYLPGYLAPAALFAINTGVRKGELISLDWRNEVRHDELMGFILPKTKNGEQRFCVCNSIARSVVESQRGKNRIWVFPGADGLKMNRSNLQFHWDAAWKASKLPSDDLTLKGPHNLRHTFGHRLRANGVSESDISSLLGHHRANITSHYSQPDIERLTMLSERVVERRETVILRPVTSQQVLCADQASG